MPAKGQQGAEGTGASFLGGKAERARTVQPQEKKAQGESPPYVYIPKGNVQQRQALLSLS